MVKAVVHHKYDSSADVSCRTCRFSENIMCAIKLTKKERTIISPDSAKS